MLQRCLRLGSAPRPFRPAPSLRQCRRWFPPEGLESIVCSNSTMGGYAERMLLSAPLLLPVPNGVDPRHAALIEPMAVGLHAVNKSRIGRNEVALVLGCGPIGIAIVASLRRQGVENIVAVDYSTKRRTLAATMGAGQTVDPHRGLTVR